MSVRLTKRVAMHCPMSRPNIYMKHQHNAFTKNAIRLLVPVIVLTGSCAAQTTNIISGEMTAMTVSAHQEEIPKNTTGVSVTVLDIPELKSEGVYTVTEAMTSVPGIYALPGGGDYQRGNVSSITLRGMRSDAYYMPIIDGMRMSGTSGSGNLSQNVMARVTLFDIGRLEVLQGAQGAILGGGAVSGIIYMETPQGKGKPSLSLFTEAGSHASYTGNITAQGTTGSLAYFLSSTIEQTDNDLTYSNGKKVPGKNAGHYQNLAQALRLDWTVTNYTTVTTTYRREDSDYHYADAYGVMPYSFHNNLLTAKIRHEFTRTWTGSLMAGYFGADTMLGHGWYSDLRNVQLEWRNDFKWNNQHKTSAGLSWTRCDYGVDSIYETDKRNNSSNLDNTYSFFAEHAWAPSQQWNNTLALRLDHGSNFDTLYTIRAASSLRFNRDQTRVFASLGSGYRAPGSFERSRSTYNNGWNVYHGNPHLDCATSLSFDMGIEHEWQTNHTISLTCFHTRLDDEIETYQATDGYHYRNAAGHWTSQGVEIALKGTWEDWYQTGYRVACTLTRPHTADNRQIPMSARQVWSADIHTSPIEGFTTGIGLNAASGRSNFSGAPTTKLDSYYTLRWYARYKVNEHLTLHLRVENLTNQKFVTSTGWEDYANFSYINTGTSIYGGCTLKF